MSSGRPGGGTSGWLIPAIASMLLWALWAFLPKLATTTMSPSSFLVWYSLGAVLTVIPFLFLKGFRPQWHARGTTYSVATGLADGVGLTMFFIAVTLGPVSVVSAVTSMHGSVTILLARVLLREKLSLQRQLGVGLAIVATLLLSYSPR